MLVLIYTGSTGAGHTLAAYSLKSILEKNGHRAIIIDAFKENGALLNRIVSKGYQQLVDHLPHLYKFLYKEFDFESRPTEAVLAQSARILRDDLLSDIETYDPNLIISTHPIVTNILGRIKDHKEFDKPILALITDHIVHDVYLRDSINAYVVSSPYTKQTVLDRGIPENKIFAYGIPIREEFREGKSKLNDTAYFDILLMAGSLGSKQLKRAFKALLKCQSKINLKVVCGNNKHLKKVVKRINESEEHPNIKVTIFGYSDQISQLMNQADVIVTKPGGLTSTEAISKNVPIIIPYTYPGQEEENAKYLKSDGMALVTDEVEELTDLIDNLAQNPNLLKKMSYAMAQTAQNYSIENTVKLCEQLAV